MTMITSNPLRRALQALRPSRSSPPAGRRPLVVQHLGFDGSGLQTLTDVLDGVGRELELELRLDGARGEVVLADQQFVERVAPQVLNAFLDTRPLLTLDGASGGAGDDLRDATRGRVRLMHGQLLRQLQALPGACRSAPRQARGLDADSGYDSAFDSRSDFTRAIEQAPDPATAELLNRLRRGLVDPTQDALVAGYGPGEVLSIDFAQGVVRVDERADQRLRLMHELPSLAGMQAARPVRGARLRDLDLVAWDLAQAASQVRLLHAPDDWWRTPLLALPGLDVRRYTQHPRQLELARELARAPATPSELRRRCRVSMNELRGFLQAVLFLGLAQWLPGEAV